MNSSPLVSILMPVYNAEKYLRQAIDSILAQTFTDFELVIVNDGSIDNSERIIKSYTDKRIVYIKQENQGVARSLNNGLKICKGKYIRRHDADDISTPEALQKQIEFISKHPEYPLIGSRIAFMTENGKIAYNYTNPTENFFNGKYYHEVTLKNYWKNRPIIHATILAKKDLFFEEGMYRTEFPTSEDIDLWFRVLEKYKVAVINEVNYFVRLHGTSNTYNHGNRNIFYRNLAKDFAIERRQKGTDPLMRGEEMPKPPKQENKEIKYQPNGKTFRNDILDYRYLIYVDAKDWKLIFQSIKTALKYGWKLKRTWKAIIFPLLGEKFVSFGVKVKKNFK